ncbi:hypothetical protein ACH4KO_08495 [Streptomyces anulatus]
MISAAVRAAVKKSPATGEVCDAATARHTWSDTRSGTVEAAADSDGVIHVAHRQDLLPSGGIDAVAAAELPIMLAYGEALAGTGKPLVAAGSIGSPGNLGRPVTEEDPALPGGDEYKGTLRVRNIVETTVVGLAERGVRSPLEKGPAGKYWHAVGEGESPFREMAEGIGSRLGLPAVSIPADVLNRNRPGRGPIGGTARPPYWRT